MIGSPEIRLALLFLLPLTAAAAVLATPLVARPLGRWQQETEDVRFAHLWVGLLACVLACLLALTLLGPVWSGRVVQLHLPGGAGEWMALRLDALSLTAALLACTAAAMGFALALTMPVGRREPRAWRAALWLMVWAGAVAAVLTDSARTLVLGLAVAWLVAPCLGLVRAGQSGARAPAAAHVTLGVLATVLAAATVMWAAHFTRTERLAFMSDAGLPAESTALATRAILLWVAGLAGVASAASGIWWWRRMDDRHLGGSAVALGICGVLGAYVIVRGLFGCLDLAGAPMALKAARPGLVILGAGGVVVSGIMFLRRQETWDRWAAGHAAACCLLAVLVGWGQASAVAIGLALVAAAAAGTAPALLAGWCAANPAAAPIQRRRAVIGTLGALAAALIPTAASAALLMGALRAVGLG